VRDVLQASRRELETEGIAGCRTANLGDGVAVTRILNRLLLYVPTHDTSLTPHLVTSGFWESWVTLVVARSVKPGNVCVNVGAHVGYYATLMAMYAGPSGRVIAVEPQEDLCRLLERTKWANRLDRLEVVNAAVGASVGESVLYSHPTLTGDASLSPRRNLSPTGKAVRRTTVDELTGGRQVDFVLIDAEGCESDIWAGMAKTLAASPDVAVVMEWYPPGLPDAAGFYDRIVGDGYAVSRVDPEGSIKPFPRDAAVASGFETLWVRR
jgi:FkbM family methyltransferase